MSMKILDIFVLAILFAILGAGLYVLLQNIPGEPIKFEEYNLNNSDIVSSNRTQFYSNMRYKDKRISYSISDSCDESARNDAENALGILSEKSVIEFYNSGQKGEINVLCSDLAPEPEEEGHFVAGEGGPSEIINTTNFAVIFSGKVSLFRDNACDKPNVAIHEILHALGFDHNGNPKSVMYPVTECDQEIDGYIIDEINRLYSIEALPDLAIEKASANIAGRFLNFEINVANFGLKESASSKLIIYAESEFVKDYDLSLIDIGTRNVLTVVNLRVPRDAEIIEFEIKTSEKELDVSNNKIEVKLIE